MIRPVLAHWRGDARFGARLAAESGVFLVLDGAGTRILHASNGAQVLAQALSDAEGRLAPRLRMADQVGASRLAADRPALVRLRLDRRGVATPITCTIVRTAPADGDQILILALPTEAIRGAALASTAPVEAGTVEPLIDDAPREPADAPASSIPAAISPVPTGTGGTAPNRFVWRSDAAGILVQVSGPAGEALGDALAGQSWLALSRSGTVLDAEGLLSALDQRRTFRAIPVTLVRNRTGEPVELEISGAPLTRTGGGFGGFGLVRAASSAIDSVRPAAEPAPSVALPSESVFMADTPPDPSQIEAAAWAEDAALDALESAHSALPPVPDADRHLSTHEHAAFREIARALGARFAGDEVPEASDAEPADRGPVCAVMPFPSHVARSADGAAGESDPAMVATLERLPTGVLVYRDDTILFANGPLIALAGYADFSDLAGAGGIGRLFRGIVPHARPDGNAPAILTRREGGGLGVDLQHSAIDWDGAPAELLLVRDAAPGEALREHQATAMARDFIAYRSADASAALDVIDDGVVILDENDRILHLNQGAATLLKLDPREVVGAGFLSLFATESAVDVLALLHGVPGPAPIPAVAAPSEIRDVVARTRGGGPSLQIRVSPLAGTDGRRACAVIRDSTATRRTEADALDARRAADAANDQKSEFLAKVSHELRTPIGGIVGLTDLMLNEQFGPIESERYRDYLGDIRAAGAHVLDLVDDLLDLARIEAGHLDLTVTAIPLNDVVSRCVALLQPQAARDRIVVRTSFSDDLATLMADERSVRQAALNVIANAIAFTEPGGQVIVSTTMADRGEIALRVRDTGIGMSPDEVETALQPFRRVDPSGSRKGTGLGLPLTKALVEANHGRFRIASRKNEGTLVEMLFPAAAAAKSA